MTTPHDEREHVHHADQNLDAENQIGRERNYDDNHASPRRERHAAEEVTQAPEVPYSQSSKPDGDALRRAPEADYVAEHPSNLDLRKDDVQIMDGRQRDNDKEHHPVRGDEAGPQVEHRTEEHHQSGSGFVEGNGSAAEITNREAINLFVRNVAKHVMEQQLVDLFSKYGQVDSAVVVRDPHSKECRGFGFVKMCTEDGAREVIAALQEFDFEGRKISVERAKRSEPHSRTPGAYMGIDRRIRDRYAGMKRHREYEVGRYPPYPPHHDMRGGGGGYRGRYYDPNRPRPDERPWDYRVPYDNQPFGDRDRLRRRYNTDGSRYPAPREYERDQRYREREPPVPRESADDYI